MALYRWYKEGRMVVESWDMWRNRLIRRSITQEYYAEYIQQQQFDGHLDLSESGVTSLGKLEIIKGNLDCHIPRSLHWTT